MKPKVCHIFSKVDHGRFFLELLDFMDAEKYELSFVMVGDKPNEFFYELGARGCEIHFVKFRGRRDLVTSVYGMARILKESRPDIVHTHLLTGSLVGLVGATLAGIRNRVSYRHHSAEAHTYFPRGVFYDRIINRLSRYIIANSGTTAEVLMHMENVPPEKVRVIS